MDPRVALYLSVQYPNAPLLAMGFSMGGGNLANYIAEEGDSCPLLGGFCVSSVWDLESCSDQIENSGLLYRMVYSVSVGNQMRDLVLSNPTPFRLAQCHNLEALLAKRYCRMKWFNDNFMSYMLGYKDTADFAAHTSPVYNVLKIRRPCIALNAEDDPMFGGERLTPIQDVGVGNPFFHMVRMATGGHVGFYCDGADGSLDRWYLKPLDEYFQLLIKVIVVSKYPSL